MGHKRRKLEVQGEEASDGVAALRRGFNATTQASSSQNTEYTFKSLPTHLLAKTFQYLDRDGLIYTSEVCKDWREAMQSPIVWETACRRHFHAPGSHEAMQYEDYTARDRYVAQSTSGYSCFDCGYTLSQNDRSPISRRRIQSLRIGHVSLVLCEACWQGYTKREAGQRLITKTSAKHAYALRDCDLKELHHAVLVNPIEALFRPMQLFRRGDVARAAIKRWGSVEGMWQKMVISERRRMQLVPS